MSYHTINEEAARRANDMNSFRDYKAGSATAEYRRMVDAATELAERQKQRVDPMYHEKIDRLLETYCRKLAENMNASYSIEARCPSILISGGGNFPVRKKEKQNAARDRNLEEWNYIQGLLDKIRSVGTGGISSDDPQARGEAGGEARRPGEAPGDDESGQRRHPYERPGQGRRQARGAGLHPGGHRQAQRAGTSAGASVIRPTRSRTTTPISGASVAGSQNSRSGPRAPRRAGSLTGAGSW